MISIRILLIVTIFILSANVNSENYELNCSINFESGKTDVAKNYCLISAEMGNLESQHLLGIIYLSNNQFTQAYSWLKRASLEGYPSSQYTLGKIYAHGWGVSQNNLFAHIWLNIASSHFPSPHAAVASGLLRRVEREMSNHEIIDAQNIALDCFTSNFTDCGY